MAEHAYSGSYALVGGEVATRGCSACLAGTDSGTCLQGWSGGGAHLRQLPLTRLAGTDGGARLRGWNGSGAHPQRLLLAHWGGRATVGTVNLDGEEEERGKKGEVEREDNE